MKKETIGKIALLSASFLWGFGFVAVQKSLDSGWSPFSLLAMRGLLGGLLFTVLSYRRKWWRNKSFLLSGVIAGIVMFISFVLQTYGQSYSTPSNAAFLTTLYVVFTPLLLRVLFKKKILPRVYLAVIVAIIGTFLLNYQGTLTFQFGDILLILCAFAFALHIILLEQMGRFDDALSLTAIQLLTMGVLSFIGMLLTKESFGSSGWIYVIYCAFISSGLAFFLQAFGQKNVNSSMASLILMLEAVFGVVGSVVFLSEQITWNMVVGGGLLLLSIVLVEMKIKTLD